MKAVACHMSADHAAHPPLGALALCTMNENSGPGFESWAVLEYSDKL